MARNEAITNKKFYEEECAKLKMRMAHSERRARRISDVRAMSIFLFFFNKDASRPALYSSKFMSLIILFYVLICVNVLWMGLFKNQSHSKKI